jgi:hypothetical protein
MLNELGRLRQQSILQNQLDDALFIIGKRNQC